MTRVVRPRSPRSTRFLALALPLLVALAVVPVDDATAAGSVGGTSWFQDPLTPSQRTALVVVPEHPRSVHGRLRYTEALYQTHGGALAVPARTAEGHQLQRGEAVTLSRRNLFVAGTSRPTRSTRVHAARLATSLEDVTAVTCEGYTDFRGSAARQRRLARNRAARICGLLAAARPGLSTTKHGFGGHVPVVVGGKSSQRAANRRVVVVATAGNASVAPQQDTVPGAPTLDTATGGLNLASLTFTAPASNGGSPITGYEWSTDQTNWHPLTTTGSSPYTVQLSSLAVGTATYYVRAVNAIGHGPASAGVPGTVVEAPTAPSILEAINSCGQIYTWFYPGAANTATVTGYQFSLDGGQTWTTAQNVVSTTNNDPNNQQMRFVNSIGGNCTFGGPQVQMIMRATSANGPSASSAPTTVLYGP